MRTLVLIIATVGAYLLLRGWLDGPGLLLRCCLAVAAIVAGLAIWGTRRKGTGHHARMISLRKATLLDYLSMGIGIVFLEACFVVFTSVSAGPAQDFAYTVQNYVGTMRTVDGLDSEDVDIDLDKDPTFGGEGSGPWIFKKNLERDLPQQSNHKPSNKPEVFVELENVEDVDKILDSRVYVSSFAFSQFDGTAWSAPQSARTIERAPIQFTQLASDRPVIEHRIYHGVNPTGQNVFTSLHGAVSTDIDQLTKLAESVYFLPEAEEVNNGYAYTASSQPLLFDDLLEKNVSPARAATGELVLPSFLMERLRGTAVEFKNKPNTTSQLLGLRDHLQKNYQYSLQTINEDNANPLENFLYTEKQGYCEHFATAAALLCRTIGVPSRVAYGWSGGRFYPKQNMLVFRAKDAHAWTEIKLKGYGWVIFDTTPSDNEAAPETSSASVDEEAPDPQETLSLDSEELNLLENSPGMELHPEVNQTKLFVGLGLLCVCAVGFLIIRRFKRKETTPDGRPIIHAQPGYLLYFKQVCADLGQPMPLGRTLRQHIAILQHTDVAPEFSNNLLDYHYQVMYGEKPKNSAKEKQLNQSIKQWKLKRSA